MPVLKVLLVLVEIISGVLLVSVILLQKSKDQGLGLAFGAGVGESLFGSRAGNVLTKITIGLAVVFMANTLLIGYLMSGSPASGSITDDLPTQAATPVQSSAGGMPQQVVPETVPVGAMPPMTQPVNPSPVTPAPAPVPAPPAP